MTDAIAGEVDPVIYEGSYTTDAGYAARFVRDSFAYRLRATALLIALGVLGQAALVFILTTELDLVARIGVSIGAALLFTAVFTAIGYLGQLSKARSLIPTGSTYVITLRQQRMSIRDWVISSENSYGLWRSAEILGDHIILRRADSGIYTPLARQLFTPEAEDWLLARVRSQRA